VYNSISYSYNSHVSHCYCNMALSSSILVRAQTASLGVTSLLCISHLHVFIGKLTATDRRMMVHTWFHSCWSINSEAYYLSVICSCCLFVDKISIVEIRFQLTLCAASAHIIMLLTQIELVEFSFFYSWKSHRYVCLHTIKCCEMRAYIQVFLGFLMKFFQRNHISDHQ